MVNHVHGTRPVHTHRPDPDSGQQFTPFKCNSPYCNDMSTAAPEEGGPPIIIQGLEPWRGR